MTSADGTTVCYRTLGDGPPLVVAHAAFATSDDYVPVAVRLASAHRVVLVDRRGYRGTDPGPTPVTFAQDAEDLRAVIEAVDPPAAVFGHSAGALAALHLALAAPGTVRALALYEPPLLFAGAERRPLLERYRELRDLGEDGEALLAFAAATSVMPTDVVRVWMDPAGLSTRVRDLAVGVGRDLEALVALAPDVEPWRGVTVPTTLLYGIEDHYELLIDSVRALAAVMPHARTAVMPGEEHVAAVVDPDLLASAVRAALAG